jgi:hypothetical protein
MRQRRLAATGPRAAGCESESAGTSGAATTNSARTATTFVGRLHDAGSVRVSGRRLLLKRRLAAARPRAARRESNAACAATTTSADAAPASFDRGLHGTGSVRLARRWQVLQRWLAAAGTHRDRRGRAGTGRRMKRSR